MCVIIYIILWFIEGLDAATPEGQKKIRCILLMSAVDLPARAILLNMKQYNGMYGCSFCYSEGTTKRGSPLHRYWPPSLTAPALRTSHSVRENASQTTRANDPVIIITFVNIIIFQYKNIGKRCQGCKHTLLTSTV